MILALTGRRIDAGDATPARFPPANVAMVAERVRRLLERERARAVVSSAACGADLVALREAGVLRLRRRIVLPFERNEFRQSSVTDRGGDWGPMFDTFLDELTAIDDVVTLAGQPGSDAAYAAANEAILDEAQALGRTTNDDVCAVLVWEGTSRGADDLTEAFGVAARQRGLRVLEVFTVKTCFVVQGFGEKVDLASGRVLNLDASYEVIKEAVESAGLRCVRADEIIHSGTIDKPMYEWLLRADLVIADLSTSNLNAVYELGVRYGLRPHTTIIVAESQFKNPFDVNHQITRFYEHMGTDIGRREAARFSKALADDIRKLMAEPATDSPVYGFLRLQPPAEPAEPAPAPRAVPMARAAAGGAGEGEASAKELLARARAHLAEEQFADAKGLLIALRVLRPRDPYITQQLALATYKSQLPDAVTALQEAKGYLQELDPETSNDPETLGLSGAVYKRLWEHTKDRSDLDRAIGAYERGFYLKQDYYTGINLAFLLNVRAALWQEHGEAAESITDFMLARRVRRAVIAYCDAALAASPGSDETRYWILATKWEAAVGLEDAALAQEFKTAVEALQVPKWMAVATRRQLSQLESLLAESPLKNAPG